MRGRLALVLVALAASGCGTARDGRTHSEDKATWGVVLEQGAGAAAGMAPQSAADGHLVPLAGRIEDGSRLRITIWGSSSCPSVVDSALLDDDGSKITLDLRADAKAPCTADVAPFTSVIQFPSGVQISSPVRVVTRRPGVTDTWTIDL